MKCAEACWREGCSFIATHDGLCRWCYGAIPPEREADLLRPIARAASAVNRLIAIPAHERCGDEFVNCPACALESLGEASEAYYTAVFRARYPDG